MDYTIREIAEKIRDVVGYPGEMVFDTSRPDGMPQKVLDVSRIRQMGWHPRVSLEEGLRQTYRYYTEKVYPKEQTAQNQKKGV